MWQKYLFASMVLSLLLLIIIPGLLLMNTYFGDPSIYLIYAKNIANGDFFSFNAGEFSSGSTSPLWALILSLSFIFDFANGPLISKILSFLSTSIAIVISFFSYYAISKNKMGSIIGTTTITYFLVIPGIMLYESSLVILLISCSIFMLHWLYNTKELKFTRQYFVFLYYFHYYHYHVRMHL